MHRCCQTSVAVYTGRDPASVSAHYALETNRGSGLQRQGEIQAKYICPETNLLNVRCQPELAGAYDKCCVNFGKPTLKNTLRVS